MFRKAIVVCTANVCRSPMAAAILRAKVGNCEIESAGTNALCGRGAATFTREVMRAHGYDVSDHRARQATEELLRTADLILTVEGAHSIWINQNFPHLRGRVHRLGKWHGDIDIIDPYGGPKEGFERTFEIINQCVTDWLKYLR